MKRWLPSPLMSAAVFSSWLLLNQTLDPAHLLLAAALGVVVPALVAPLRPEQVRIGRWGTVARLAAVVLWDIVLANVEVARRILGPEAAIRPRFVWVPLTIRDPYGIVSLAGIITMTPGTLSSALTPDRRYLLVHAFHVDGDARGEAELVASIKQRYERPLIEIFEAGAR
jgi:multicomponent K+:H+ antiporter subunit E